MNDLSSLARRADVIAVLAQHGVYDAAQEFLVAATAPSRHALRVDAVKAACVPYAPSLGGDDRNAVVWFALLDHVGVGGALGVTGDGTDRVPIFRALGTGRKQARDGAAWTSAIAAARDEALQGQSMIVEAESCGLDTCPCCRVVLVLGEYRTTVWTGVGSDDQELGSWVRALAGCALKQAAGLSTGTVEVNFRGPVADWARVFNEACRCVAKSAAARHLADTGALADIHPRLHGQVVDRAAEHLALNAKGRVDLDKLAAACEAAVGAFRAAAAPAEDEAAMDDETKAEAAMDPGFAG